MKNRITTAISILILVFSVVPNSNSIITNVKDLDKLAHTVMYMLVGLAFFADQYLTEKKIVTTKRNLFFCLGFVFLFGLLVEIIQFFTPYRSFSLLDIAANIAGGLLAIAVVLMAKKTNIFRRPTPPNT